LFYFSLDHEEKKRERKERDRLRRQRLKTSNNKISTGKNLCYEKVCDDDAEMRKVEGEVEGEDEEEEEEEVKMEKNVEVEVQVEVDSNASSSDNDTHVNIVLKSLAITNREMWKALIEMKENIWVTDTLIELYLASIKKELQAATECQTVIFPAQWRQRLGFYYQHCSSAHSSNKHSNNKHSNNKHSNNKHSNNKHSNNNSYFHHTTEAPLAWFRNAIEGYANPPENIMLINHAKHSHWNFFLYSIPTSSVSFFCSLGWDVEREKLVDNEALIKLCYPELSNISFKLTNTKGKGPQQRSSWECGYFLLQNIENLARKLTLTEETYNVKKIIEKVRIKSGQYLRSLE
jgi:hypothetical protein